MSLNETFLTVEEAAVRLDVSVATVRRWCADGKLSAEKVGRQWVIEESSLPRTTKRSSPQRTQEVDLERTLTHLQARDLTPKELWVPDVLLFQDHLSAPQDALEAASARIQSTGPFDPLERIQVPKTALFTRPGSAPSLPDRIAYHACVLSMAQKIEQARLATVYSARRSSNDKYLLENGRDLFVDWKRACREMIHNGFEWMITTDITGYFDNIQLKLLFSDIDALSVDPQVSRTLKRMLGEWSHDTGVGIPQGPDASRVLGNYYLHPVDQAMSQGPWKYLRYMDDMAIFGRTKAEAISGLRVLERETRRRVLSLASKKTEILHGADALAQLREAELDKLQYLVASNKKMARSALKKLFKRALKSEGNIVRRWVLFALFRLRELRESGILGQLFRRLDDLAPVAPIVAMYLLPWIERDSVSGELADFVHDSTRNSSPFLSTWLLAAMRERRPPLPDGWVDYARTVTRDRNQPTYHRTVAAILVARGGQVNDIEWLEREVRTEFDPSLARGYLVALAGISRLNKGITNTVTARHPGLEVTANYLQGRVNLPSMVYSTYTVDIVDL